MAQRIENMKSVPIKNYDFQVDFKVKQEDVLENFLNPNENKHISANKRQMSAKTSTWGTPKSHIKKFETAKIQGPDLTIKGTANPDSENAMSDNPIAANIFHFKSHLPAKKLSDNPKLALGMFKKKTIGTKSKRVLQGPEDNFENRTAIGFFHNEDLRTKLLTSAQSNNAAKHLMTGFSGGRKMTAKGANTLKELKETNALKSSGAGHGLFQKRPLVNTNEEGKKEEKKSTMNRPKSAIVSSAVSFMQSLKKEKKLKPPKKPDFMNEDEDIENEDGNIQEEEFNERTSHKKKNPGSNKLIKPKNVNEFDDSIFNKEEEIVATESFNPVKNRPQSAQVIRPIPKKKKKLLNDEYYDEDYELHNIDAIKSTGREDEVEEYNELEQPEDIPEDDDQEQEEENQEEQEKKERPSEFKRRFRSNIAHMLSELQQDVLITSNDISFTPSKNRGSDSATKKRWQKREKDETEIRNKNEMEGHKVKKMLGINKGGFVPYNYTSTIDGDIAQRQREEVTEEITDYLRKADEKRYKKLEMEQKKKNIKHQGEPQEINEYSDRIGNVNSRLKSSLQVMRNIVSDSKATTTQQNNILEIEDDD